MKDSSVSINLVVALMAEAKPFIEKLTLVHTAQFSAFKIYTSGNGKICLVISGIGRNNAAAATAYLAAIQPDRAEALWINAGIAGHTSLSVGDVVIASKVHERATGHIFYPSIYPTSFTTTDLITVDQPETAYAGHSAFDMEASAFVATASKFSPIEFVQSVKVISDNLETGIESVSKQSIEKLALTLVSAVSELVDTMRPTVVHRLAQIYLPAAFDELRGNAHFSATQTVQLKRLCQRFSALGLEANLTEVARHGFRSSKECIRALESELSRPPIGTEEGL